MFRVKITAVLSLLIIIIMVIVYILLPLTIENEIKENTTNAMHIAATSLEHAEKIESFSVLAKAKEIASFNKLKTSLTDEYPDNYEHERHLGVYNKGLLRWQYVFENLAKLKGETRNTDLPLNERRPFFPELCFVTDENGVGVAALGKGKYDWYNESIARSFPSILSVSKGKAFTDIWLWKWSEGEKPAMYHVGVAPIMQGQEVRGAVVTGHLIHDGKAKQDSVALEGHDVAYFHDGKVYASSLSPSKEEELSGRIFGNDSSLGSGRDPDVVSLSLNNEKVLALVRYHSPSFPNTSPTSGFIVLTHLEHELILVNKVRTAIPVFGLILLIAMLATVLIAFSSFVKPFEQIDQGIQGVLAGNKDHIFKVSSNYVFQSEMAHSLNLMSAYLQGKPMPDEEEEDDSWQDFLVSEVTQTSIMRALQGEELPERAHEPVEVAVSTENRDIYQRRVYDEYITAKKNLGEDIADIDYDGFIKRMEKNAAQLKDRHKAKDIRFDVVVRDGKVVLKPQPIMK